MKKLILFTVIFLVACAHHRDVRPGENNLHRVVIQTDDKEAGARSALEQAEHFCKEQKKKVAIVQEDQKYTGDLDEKTYNDAKRVTQVAKTVGGGVWVFGGQRESDIGGIVGLGGAAGDAALGKGYTVEMRFRCN